MSKYVSFLGAIALTVAVSLGGVGCGTRAKVGPAEVTVAANAEDATSAGVIVVGADGSTWLNVSGDIKAAALGVVNYIADLFK